MAAQARKGPLAGIKIVELAGIGPGPMAAMVLADLGAEVLRIERREAADLGVPKPLKYNLLMRSRSAIALDLKDPSSVQLVLELVSGAHALIEGFRPGVMERLGLGPDVCLAHNPKLVYGRVTGWGQEGPLAMAAGHDINYIALAGVLNAIGRKGQPPSPPLALLGDMGGGGMFLALGILAGLLHARTTGEGQVVDAAMVDGAASLATAFQGMVAAGGWGERGTNILDSGAPHYDCYECADGQWISIGPIEARFHAQLVNLLGLDPGEIGLPGDRSSWPQARTAFARAFRQRDRQAWCALLEGTDACFSPVLSFEEASRHPHLLERGTYVNVDGVVQAAPAPRFSRTPTQRPTAPEVPRGAECLEGWLTPQRCAHWQSVLPPVSQGVTS